MLIQIYGQFGGLNSNAIVSRGIACGLHQHSLDVQIFDPGGEYNGLWRDLTTGLSPSADVGIAIGYPTEMAHYLRGHAIKVGCFIAESSILPAAWSAAANTCDLVCVPSQWVADAFIRGGVAPSKLLVVPHGLHPAYAKQSLLSPSPSPRPFLHVAAAPAFRERKGTFQLIEAFGHLVHWNSDLRLMLRCGITDPELVEAIKRTGVPENFLLTEDGPLEPKVMRTFYCHFEALVLPSRAEAFGMCAIEARALGIPVILTHASGHLQHADEKADTVIKTGEECPCRVNGIPGGMAPSVTSDAILDALLEYLKHRHSIWVWAQRRACGYYGQYSWKNVLVKLVKWLKSHKRRVSHPGLCL